MARDMQQKDEVIKNTQTRPPENRLCPPGKCEFGNTGQCIHCGQHRAPYTPSRK